MMNKTQKFSLLTSDDIYLFKHANHFRLYEKLGSRIVLKDGRAGAYFCVWAPNAGSVFVIGDFNAWDISANPLFPRADSSGIWEGFIEGVKAGDCYKYLINSSFGDFSEKKADPFAFYAELPEKTSSRVWDLNYQWEDAQWMEKRKHKSSQNAPVSIYEVHLGSWRRNGNKWLSYKEIALGLAKYCAEMGWTHIELMPITEHPYSLSWGYQTTGYFAATSRFGSPQDLMAMIDILHQAGIAVILDWAPAHFPLDKHGLARFDGTALYEYADKRIGFHPDWNSAIFDYSKNEVRNFLISSASFWLDKYHIDGIRVDAVSSMLYLDYSRKDGEWIPNKYGGRENIEAIDFLRKLNRCVYENFEGVQTYAEESTSWAFVSKPEYLGGLGFGYKWNMGWMNDILRYIKIAPNVRSQHYDELTHSFSYAFSENFLLPFSHDEVSHGKGSLIGKMTGGKMEKFDAIRLLIGYMFAYPGKKLLFMGCEFAQEKEWDFDGELEWDCLSLPQNAGVQNWIKDLNRAYKQYPALYEDANSQDCEIIVGNDSSNSILAFMRKSPKNEEYILCVFNFMPFVRHGYKIGVDYKGRWDEILNSDAREYFGSGVGNFGFKNALDYRMHDKPYAIEVSIAPLGAVFFRYRKPTIEERDYYITVDKDRRSQDEREIPQNHIDKIYDIDGLKLL